MRFLLLQHHTLGINTKTDELVHTDIKPDAAKDCLKSSELLVTRVDVALGLMSEFFCGNFDGNVSHFLCRPGHDVPASTASQELVLSFSDGR